MRWGFSIMESHQFEKHVFFVIYGLMGFLIFSQILVACQKNSQLTPVTTPTTTTTTTTTNPPTFGVCGKGECVDPFCAEDCKSPETCHVKDIEGICRPSCGYAAYLAGWGHYGPDGDANTSDDIHTYRSHFSSCDEVIVTYEDGITRDDWHAFDNCHGVIPHEVIEHGGVCCVRAEPKDRPPPCDEFIPASQ